MKKILSFFLAIVMGFGLWAQQTVIDGDAYSTGFDYTYDWQFIGDWDADLLLGDDYGMMIFVHSDAASNELDNEAQSPIFRLNASDCDAQNNGFVKFNVFTINSNGDSIASTYMLFLKVGDNVYPAGSSTINSRQGFKTINISLSSLASVITSPQDVDVQFIIAQTGISGEGYFVLDDFELRTRDNAYVIHFFDNDMNEIGYDYAAEDGSFVSPEWPEGIALPTGYSFAYWDCYHMNAAGDSVIPMGIGLMANEEVTGIDEDMWWVAVYGKNVTISFNANGGNGTMQSIGGVQYLFTEAPACTFTRSGYDFNGWNTRANGSGAAYAVGDTLDLVEGLDVTLFAQWIANGNPTDISITFVGNGGLGNMPPVYVTQNTSYTVPECAFTRQGYTFSCWNTSVDGSGVSYAPGSTLSSATNVILYALWTLNSTPTVTITFNANGGVGTMNPVNIAQNTSYTVPVCSYTRNGYTFNTWNTAANGSGVSYAPGTALPTTSDITLYALWTENGGGGQGGQTQTITITFVANGGTGTMNAVTVAQNSAYTVPACSFVRNGYTFNTWNTVANGSGVSYAPGTTLPTTANITLYAIWTENGGGGQGSQTENVTITYVANGGTGTMTPAVVTKNSTYVVLACAYTRDGYTFDTWNTQPNGSGVSYAPGTILPTNADVALYAIWRQNSSTGIADVATMSVSVYPNPAVSMVTVNGANVQNIDVLDLVGRVVRNNEGVNTIDLSGLNKGVYMLRIRAKEGVAVKRIVKE